MHRSALREWMGIEPTLRTVSRCHIRTYEQPYRYLTHILTHKSGTELSIGLGGILAPCRAPCESRLPTLAGDLTTGLASA